MHPTLRVCAVSTSIFVAWGSLGAQQPRDPAITIVPGFDAEHFVDNKAPIELSASRWPNAQEGRLAVLIGNADLTALFERVGAKLIYRANGLAIPSGQSEVKAFLVTGAIWTLLGQFPIRVLTPHGFEEAEIDPGLELTNKGQLAEEHSGSEPRPDRHSYQDIGGIVSLQSDHQRGSSSLESQVHILGTSYRREALRFGSEGDLAPLIDLADFLVVAKGRSATLSAGNVSAGMNRHLINSFASRGFSGAVTGNGTTFSVAAQNGSSIVGWDNIAGVANPDHRILSAAVGVELVRATPGALHLDATAVHGSLLPLTGYSQSGIVDPETSDGFGVQLAASLPSQRVRIAGGIASSTFRNPTNVVRSGSLSLSPAAAITKNASYAEVNIALVQGVRLWHAIPVTLNGAFRNERVDPLYRSVATPTQADLVRSVFELVGNIDAVAVQSTLTRSSDNLDGVASLLTTDTRTSLLVVSTPTAALVRAPKTSWLPVITYSRLQIHQYGAGIPSNSTLLASDIPDQLSVAQDAGAQWEWGTWRLGYHYNATTQDNRQPGLKQADFAATIHGVSLGVSTRSHLDFGLELGVERHDNKEFSQVSELTHVSVTTNWQAGRMWALDAGVMASQNDDPGAGHDTRLTDIHAGIVRRIAFGHGRERASAGQVFLRFARRANTLTQFGLPLLPPLPQSGAMWTLTSGLSIRLF